MPINPKQLQFIKEYRKDRNGTQAATRAGYSKHTANEQAVRLLANISIREEIQRLDDLETKKEQVTREEIVGELKKMGFGDVDGKAKHADKHRALDSLAKILGLYTETRKLDVTDEFAAFIKELQERK